MSWFVYLVLLPLTLYVILLIAYRLRRPTPRWWEHLLLLLLSYALTYLLI